MVPRKTASSLTHLMITSNHSGVAIHNQLWPYEHFFQTCVEHATYFIWAFHHILISRAASLSCDEKNCCNCLFTILPLESEGQRFISFWPRNMGVSTSQVISINLRFVGTVSKFVIFVTSVFYDLLLSVCCGCFLFWHCQIGLIMVTLLKYI